MLGRVQVHAYAGGVPSMHLAFGLVVCEIVFSLSDRSRSARATEDAPSSSVAVSLHTATILLSVGLSASRALALPSLSVSELLCLPLALWAVGAPVVRVFFTSPRDTPRSSIAGSNRSVSRENPTAVKPSEQCPG